MCGFVSSAYLFAFLECSGICPVTLIPMFGRCFYLPTIACVEENQTLLSFEQTACFERSCGIGCSPGRVDGEWIHLINKTVKSPCLRYLCVALRVAAIPVIHLPYQGSHSENNHYSPTLTMPRMMTLFCLKLRPICHSLEHGWTSG